jgi:diguanylate cyclase (GGDEF)-like protein
MSGDMSSEAAPYPAHAAPTAARVCGFLLIAGGSMAIVLTLVGPGFANGRAAAPAIGSIAACLGIFCAVAPGRVPAWVLPLLPALGTVMIAMSSLLTHTATDGSELLYMWPVLFSAYFMSLRVALANAALIAAVYPPLALSILGKTGITPSVYLIGTSIITLLIVASLRRRIERLLAASALEARTDGLTGLANRRSWAETLDREIPRQARLGTSLAVLMIDLDHFKRLNDSAGHAAGDAALVGLADLLRGQARQSDVLARVGGEEFALALPDCGPEDALVRAEQIRSVIEVGSAPWPTPITVSIGVAALPAHGSTGDDLMAAADAALYAAKAAGRNTARLAAGPPAPARPCPAGTPEPTRTR